MSFLFNFASDEDGPDPEKLSSHVPSQSGKFMQARSKTLQNLDLVKSPSEKA